MEKATGFHPVAFVVAGGQGKVLRPFDERQAQDGCRQTGGSNPGAANGKGRRVSPYGARWLRGGAEATRRR
jgi:hypothetical protein